MSTETTFAFEPEVLLPVPRPTRLKRFPRVLLCALALFGLVFSGLVVYAAWGELNELYALRDRGQTSNAAITGKWSMRGKSTSYYIDYLLHTPSGAVSGEVSVDASHYYAKEIHDTITLTYLPAQPSIRQIGVVDNRVVRNGLMMWIALASGVAVLSLGLLGGCYWDIRQEVRIVRLGQAAQGTVVRLTPPSKGDRYNNYDITYRFAGPKREITQHRFVLNAAGKLLAEGMEVTVLYDPQKPRRSYLYRALRYTEIVS